MVPPWGWAAGWSRTRIIGRPARFMESLHRWFSSSLHLCSRLCLAMKLGVFTVLFSELDLEPMLDRVVALGLDAVELGTGNYPGSSHCDPDALLADAGKRRALLDAIEERGLVISARSCHGNPLHPDDAFARGS